MEYFSQVGELTHMRCKSVHKVSLDKTWTEGIDSHTIVGRRGDILAGEWTRFTRLIYEEETTKSQKAAPVTYKVNCSGMHCRCDNSSLSGSFSYCHGPSEADHPMFGSCVNRTSQQWVKTCKVPLVDVSAVLRHIKTYIIFLWTKISL